jgi:hypothetical protein
MKINVLALAGGLLVFVTSPLLAQQPAAASSSAKGHADDISGDYTIAVSRWAPHGGSATIRKQGPLYALTFKVAEMHHWQGIAFAIAPRPGANTELWAAIGSREMVSLGIYQARGGTFRGVWYPLNAADDPAVYGSETLIGQPTLGGSYEISGRLPNTGETYTGALKVESGTAVLNGDGQTCLFKWKTGTFGAGFRVDDLVAVCAGWGEDCQIVRFRIESGNLSGEFYGKDKAKGEYTLTK